MRQRRNQINLTEAQLHRIVCESVRKTLTENEEDEGWFDFIKGAGNKVGKDVGAAAQKGAEAVGNAAQRGYNATKNYVNNKYTAAKQGVTNYANNVKAAGQEASKQAEIGKARKWVEYIINKGWASRNLLQAFDNEVNGTQAPADEAPQAQPQAAEPTLPFTDQAANPTTEQQAAKPKRARQARKRNV